MAAADRTELVHRLAREAGFARVGIAPAGPLLRAEYVWDWLDRGCGGEMAYLRRVHHLRADTRRLLPGARSIIVVAESYRPASNGPCAKPACDGPCAEPAFGAHPSTAVEPARGRVARYAWGRDYHRVLRRKLRRLADALHSAVGEPFGARVCVDTAPIVEREAAAAAGIGWIGKNTMVLHQDAGSFFFLGEIITTLVLDPSKPSADHCGSCTRCLEVCPTGALVEPYQMDARRCIAYLTIEHRGDVPADLQPKMADWVFGCDVCQEVCPYNRSAATAPTARDPAYGPGPRNRLAPRPVLSQLLALTEQEYRHYLAGSAMKRATLSMLKRNAAIACHNLACRRGGDGRPA